MGGGDGLAGDGGRGACFPIRDGTPPPSMHQGGSNWVAKVAIRAGAGDAQRARGHDGVMLGLRGTEHDPVSSPDSHGASQL